MTRSTGPGFFPTPQQTTLLRDSVMKGRSPQAICRALGVSAITIENWCAKLGFGRWNGEEWGKGRAV